MLNYLHELFSNAGNAANLIDDVLFAGIGQNQESEGLDQLKYEVGGLMYNESAKNVLVNTPYHRLSYSIEAGGKKKVAFAEYEYDRTLVRKRFGTEEVVELPGREVLENMIGDVPDDIEEVELANDNRVTNVIFELPTIKITSKPTNRVAFMYYTPDANVSQYGYLNGQGEAMSFAEQREFDKVLEMAVYTYMLDMYELTFFEKYKWDGDRYPYLLNDSGEVHVTPMMDALKQTANRLNVLGFSQGTSYQFVAPFMDNLKEVYISRYEDSREVADIKTLEAASMVLNKFLEKTNGHPMRDKLFFSILTNYQPYIDCDQTRDIEVLAILADGLELDAKFVMRLLSSSEPHDDAEEMEEHLVGLLNLLEQSALNRYIAKGLDAR